MIAPQYNILKNGYSLLFYLNDDFDIGGVTSTINDYHAENKLFSHDVLIFGYQSVPLILSHT